MPNHTTIKTVIAFILISVMLMSCTTQAAETKTTEGTYKETKVTRGDITTGISETATATISAVAHTFSAQGEVEEIYVKAGQQVKAGDSIAVISIEDLQTQLNKLELSYSQAQVKLEQAKINKELTTMEATYEYTTNKSLESTAPLTYSQTINSLDYEMETTMDEIKEAKDKVSTYESKLGSTGYYKDYNIEGLSIELSDKKAETEEATVALQAAKDAEIPNDILIMELTLALNDAQKSLSTAQSSYNSAYDKYETSLEKAETEIENLEKTITSLRNSYSQTSSTEESTKLKAQYTLDESLNKSNNADTLYEIQLSQLDAEIKSQELSLQESALEINELKNSMGETIVTAKCDGIIMSVTVKVGDNINSGTTIATVANALEVYVMTSISQEDINSITLGTVSEVSFDSSPKNKYTAVVDSITTTPARTSSSTVSYQVYSLVQGDLDKIYEGMTGNIIFVEDQVKNVLSVSSRSITTNEKNSYIKIKQEDGTIVETPVIIGFTDGRNTEIISGISEGDIVITESGVTRK